MNIDILNKWNSAKKMLDHYKDEESKLRAEVIKSFFPEHKSEGVENFDLSGGYKLKANFKLNYELTKEAASLAEVVGKLRDLGEDGEAALKGLFKIKYELSTKQYKSLLPSIKKIVDDVVTIKIATPSIEIVEPKNEK